jgi:hypothetical protein
MAVCCLLLCMLLLPLTGVLLLGLSPSTPGSGHVSAAVPCNRHRRSSCSLCCLCTPGSMPMSMSAAVFCNAVGAEDALYAVAHHRHCRLLLNLHPWCRRMMFAAITLLYFSECFVRSLYAQCAIAVVCSSAVLCLLSPPLLPCTRHHGAHLQR